MGALLSSTFYQLAVNDIDGVLGNTLRMFIGTHTEPTIRVIIATIQFMTILSTIFLTPAATCFTPFCYAYQFGIKRIGQLTSEDKKAKAE
jgi:hypothetical protein